MKPHEIEASLSFYLRHLSICMDIIIPQKRVMASGAFNSLLFFLFFLLRSLASCHPLDPLTPCEINSVRRTIQHSHPGLIQNLTFHFMSLDDPDKPKLLSWLSNRTKTPPPRRAFVTLWLQNQIHEIIIDIIDNSIASDRTYDGYGYPIPNSEEEDAANALPFSHVPFVKSIRKRGLDISKVLCETFLVGWFGERKAKRGAKIRCFYRGATGNIYMQPLDGIWVTVDLDAMVILEFKGRIRAPMPKAQGTDYRASMQRPPFAPQTNGITVVQPDGPTFTIDGHMIRLAHHHHHHCHYYSFQTFWSSTQWFLACYQSFTFGGCCKIGWLMASGANPLLLFFF